MRRLAASALLAPVSFLVFAARPAAGEDTVRACIAASTDGQTQHQQGKLLAAREDFLACARDACPAIVRSHCARWLAEIEQQIPSVVVRAQDAGGGDVLDAQVLIDGQHGKLDGQPVRLDPGDHTIVIETRSGARKQERVLLVAGEPTRVVTVRLPGRHDGPTPTPTLPQTPAPTLSHHVATGAWILGGAGVAVLGVATYFGFAAASQLSTLQNRCSPHCLDAQTQTGRHDALAFQVLLGVGGAAVGAAAVWALVFPTTGPAVDVRPVSGGLLTSVTVRY